MDSLTLPEPLKSLIKSLEAGAITNLYGGPGTGKTNICLLACLECVRNKGKVIFIDTEGGFSLERIKQLTPDTQQLLEQVELVEPKTFQEQGKILRMLTERDCKLVIVDSAVALYRLEHGNDAPSTRPGKQLLEANRELSKQMSILSNLAREKKIPVLVTTHTFRNWDTGANEVVGGDSVKYWSKAVVFLEHTGKTSERKATIVKHRFLPENRHVKFMIVEEGIKPSGFRLF